MLTLVDGSDTPPFLPWAQAVYDGVNARDADDLPFVDNRTICLPDGGVDVMLPPYLFRFVQTPDRLYMLTEFNNQTRTVYMDEQLPADLEPSWYGRSVGRLSDDALIVETTGFNDRTPLMTLFLGGRTRTNVPHSDQLRVTEEYTLSDDGNTLTNRMTIDDPGTFTDPWAVDLVYVRLDDEQLMEFVCADDPVLLDPDNPPDLDGLITVGPEGKFALDLDELASAQSQQ